MRLKNKVILITGGKGEFIQADVTKVNEVKRMVPDKIDGGVPLEKWLKN